MNKFLFYVILLLFLQFVGCNSDRTSLDNTHLGGCILIDPVADKVCMMVVLIYLIISYKLPFLIFFLTLAIRDIFLIIIGVYLMFSQEEVFQSNRSGKWFIGISALMMVFFLFKNPLNIPGYILWTSYSISCLLFIFSTYEYIRRYLRYFKQLETG